MPTYRLRCAPCGDQEQWGSIHDPIPNVCTFCGGVTTQVLTPPHLAAAATPNRTSGVVAANNREVQWSRDRDAYKRLRDDGLQPPTVSDCAELESLARTRAEVETKTIYETKHPDARVNEASERLGRDVLTPADPR